jgi:hypothetical protein
MPTNHFITKEQLMELFNKYKNNFNDELCDITHLLDTTKTKKALGITDKIKSVWVFAETHTEYKNELNDKIIYKVDSCCADDHPKCKVVKWGDYTVSVSRNPVGDSFIVI